MKIDAHQHFWNYDQETFGWISDDMAVIRKSFGPEDLKPILDYLGFDGCVFVQVNQTEQETIDYNEVALKNDFMALHDTFHTIVGLCKAEDEHEH